MKTSLIALTTALTLGLGTASAFADTVGENHRCVRLSDIRESPVINDKTIVLKMRSKDDFKRVDMRGTCSGMKFSGIGHTTPTDELCTSDAITVLQPVGAACMIEKIVTINKAEADSLLSTR